MIFADHRLSRDIDAFIDDPQYLALLSPETTDVWKCSAWDRAAHYLKLKYPEGEIDFIVTAPISSLPPIEKQIDLTAIRKGSKPTIQLDPLVEIALKKLHYRAAMLKPRDVFDIAVIDAIDGDALLANLHEVAGKKDDLLRRLDNIKEDFLQAELAELDIRPRWSSTKRPAWRPSAVSSDVFRSPAHERVVKPLARCVQNRKHLRSRSTFSLDVSE